jgi:hypothetical protein
MSRMWVAVVVMLVLAAGAFWYTQRDTGVTLPPENTATSTPTKAVPVATSSATTTKANIPVSARLVEDIVTPTILGDMPETGWKKAIATVFWAGEGEDADNGYITNVESAWDGDWMQHFGGVDDADDRCGFNPCDFTPKENPFYIALPYNDLDDNGDTKANAKRVPWYRESEKSIIKNRWVAVRADPPRLASQGEAGGKVCYGQWEDVGPFHEDDIEYVFGTAPKPLNTEGEKAGIDLSPALRDCLGVDGSSNVEWRHVEENDVPQGPWKNIITTRASQ